MAVEVDVPSTLHTPQLQLEPAVILLHLQISLHARVITIVHTWKL